VSALPENYPTSSSAPAPRSLYPGTVAGYFAASGLALWVIIWWAFTDSLWPTYRVKYVYVATTAEIIDTRIQETIEKGNRQTGPYVASRPQVRIRYTADGHPYDSWIDLWWSDSDANDTVKTAGELARLKPGTSVPAWYDPAQPDRAVVTPKYRSWEEGLIRLLLGAVMLVYCIFGLWHKVNLRGVARAPTSPPPAADTSPPPAADTPAPPAPDTKGKLAMSLVSIVLGGYMMWGGFFSYLWPTYRVKYVYVPTTAEVLDTRITQKMVHRHRASDYIASCPQVRIRYIADGRQYESWNDVYIGVSDAADRAKAAAALARFKPGTSVPAWYDPDEPYHAVVTREYRTWSQGLVLVIIGAMCFLLAAYLYFGPTCSVEPPRDNPEATIGRRPPRTEEGFALPENYAADLCVTLALALGVTIGSVMLHYGIRNWYLVFLMISIVACVLLFQAYRYFSAWRSWKAQRDHLETTNDRSPQREDEA
jgi:Protein of unknown function (DUF3592)